MTDELKPCPFCGGTASDAGHIRYGKPLTDTTWADGTPIIEAFYVNCMQCGAVAKSGFVNGFQTKAEAVKRWNTRAIEREEDAEARHAAEMREQAERFSDAAKAVQRTLRANHILQAQTQVILAPFIIPAPDPLVEALKEADIVDPDWVPTLREADNLRAAMQARGYEWRKIGEVGE